MNQSQDSALIYAEYMVGLRVAARQAAAEQSATGVISPGSRAEFRRLGWESVPVYRALVREMTKRTLAGERGPEIAIEAHRLAEGNEKWGRDLAEGAFRAAVQELAAAKRTSAPMTPGGAMIAALNIKPGTEYYGWVFAVGIPASIVAGFAASSWMWDNAGFTSFGVFAVVGIIGCAVTGWLAKKR